MREYDVSGKRLCGYCGHSRKHNTEECPQRARRNTRYRLNRIADGAIERGSDIAVVFIDDMALSKGKGIPKIFSSTRRGY